MKRIASKLATAWLERGARKRFAGNLFERLEGLEPLLDRCSDATVLDVGCCDGLVAYEFARRGARLIHGFERDDADVLFARRLFRDVPVESAFVRTDLAADGRAFRERHADLLLERYDVVLYLGVHHHLERQMERDDLDAFIAALAELAAKHFAVRTARLDRVEPLLSRAGFVLESEAGGAGRVGPLRVYRRSP